MKKTFILIFAALIAVPVASFAQKTTVTRINRERTYKTSTRTFDVWYQGEVSLGFATGGKLKWKDGGETEKTDYSRVFLSTVHGARITKYAFVGLGAGIQGAYGKLDPDDDGSDNWETAMIPLFLNLKGYYPVSDDFAPYVSVSLGSSICAGSFFDESGKESGGEWETKLKGGFYGEYGVGFNYKHLDFGLGLQHQSMKFTATYGGNSGEEKAGINSFFVKIGVKF